MSRKCDQTFQATLLAVGPANIKALELKASIAALLARTFPLHAGVLGAIEATALDRIFRILTDTVNSRDVCSTVDQRSDREPAEGLADCRLIVNAAPSGGQKIE